MLLSVSGDCKEGCRQPIVPLVVKLSGKSNHINLVTSSFIIISKGTVGEMRLHDGSPPCSPHTPSLLVHWGGKPTKLGDHVQAWR